MNYTTLNQSLTDCLSKVKESKNSIQNEQLNLSMIFGDVMWGNEDIKKAIVSKLEELEEAVKNGQIEVTQNQQILLILKTIVLDLKKLEDEVQKAATISTFSSKLSNLNQLPIMSSADYWILTSFEFAYTFVSSPLAGEMLKDFAHR